MTRTATTPDLSSVLGQPGAGTGRIYNFCAGPSMLPQEVLHQAQDDIWNIAGSGMGIMEISHRGPIYDRILREAEEDARKVGNIPSNYKVIFTTGGATSQNFQVPANVLPDQGVAAYRGRG